MNVVGQHRRIFLLRCSLKVYTVISFLWSLNVQCCSAEPILQLDPPTNAAIGPSPAQRCAATSKNPTICTLPSDVISHNSIHHLCNDVRAGALAARHPGWRPPRCTICLLNYTENNSVYVYRVGRKK